jgi:hypothetical protein
MRNDTPSAWCGYSKPGSILEIASKCGMEITDILLSVLVLSDGHPGAQAGDQISGRL